MLTVLVTEIVARAGETWSRSVGLSNRKCGGGAGGSRSAPSVFLKNPTNESGGILREFVEINGLNEGVPRFRKSRKEIQVELLFGSGFSKKGELLLGCSKSSNVLFDIGTFGYGITEKATAFEDDGNGALDVEDGFKGGPGFVGCFST